MHVHALKQDEVTLLKTKYVTKTGHPKSLLTVTCLVFCWLNDFHGSSGLKTMLSAGTQTKMKISVAYCSLSGTATRQKDACACSFG